MAEPEKLEGEPLLSKKRGRPAKWFPQVVRPEDTRLALQWMDKFCPEDKTLLRLRRDWNTFRRLNPNLSPVELETSRCFNARKQESKDGGRSWCNDWWDSSNIVAETQCVIHLHADATDGSAAFAEASIVVFVVPLYTVGLVGQWIRADLEGTMGEYFKKIMSCESNPATRLVRRRITNTLNKAHAISETKEFIAGSLPQLRQALREVRRDQSTGDEASGLELIMKLGLRAVDLSRIQYNRIELHKEFTLVVLKWTKGIKKRQHRRILRIPLWFGPLQKDTLRSFALLARKGIGKGFLGG